MKYVQAIVFCLMSYVLVVGSVFGSGAEFNYRDRVDDPELAGKKVKMRFEFHSVSNGSAGALFSTNMTVQVASNGVFCAEVGVRNELFATTNDLYVAVLEPRTDTGVPTNLLHGCRRKLMPVPTAIYAQDAGGAPDGFIVRGKTHFLGGYDVSDEYKAYKIDADGRLTVADLVADAVQGDDGNFKGHVNVGGSLTMTKSMALNDEGGRTFTGENTTLVAKGVEVKSITMPESAGLPVPTGLIMMWYGEANKVPSGWALCDGNVHDGVRTPDLTGLFVVGATLKSGEWNSYQVRGGARSVTLTTAQMPKHGHNFFGDDQLVARATKAEDHHGYDASSSKSGDSAMFKTKETGGSKAHENRPPFKAVYYIMKVK